MQHSARCAIVVISEADLLSPGCEALALRRLSALIDVRGPHKSLLSTRIFSLPLLFLLYDMPVFLFNCICLSFRASHALQGKRFSVVATVVMVSETSRDRFYALQTQLVSQLRVCTLPAE
jgi:hypothetical protein